MLKRKLLLLTLLTAMSWLSVMAQNVVNVNGNVTNVEGDPQSDVNILVSAYFGDSTAVLHNLFTDANGNYTVDIETPVPNVFGWVEVSMVDCWGTLESQFFTIMNGNEIFTADFIYCEDIVMDSCTVFILEEWVPGNLMSLTAWIPVGMNAAYIWSTGESTQMIFPQSNGTYCVTATFDSGCVMTDCTEVYIDSSFCFAYIVSYLNPDSSTVLEAIAASGIAPFTYAWTTGETTPVIQNVQPGTYCVVVTDATGCAYSTCIIVDDNSFCEVHIYEEPTGGLYAQGYGQEVIQYLWSTGDSSQVIFPNAPGYYCVTMYDAAGCTATSCYDYGWGQDSSCYVYINAFVLDSNIFALQALNYTPANAWEYLWSTGETAETIYPQDPSQSYCVTMTDSEGCVSSACYNISDWCYAWVDLHYVDTNSAVISVYTDPIFNLPGGNQPTYEWSNGSTTPTITVTESGEYCVTVTFGSVCVTEACTWVDFEGLENQCSAWIYQYTDSTGLWIAEAYAWGEGTFEYLWSNGDTNSVTYINSPNEFTCVTVTSSFGCETVACTDTFFLPCEAFIDVLYLSNTEAILTANLWNNPAGNASFLWNTGETSQEILVNAGGTYCVTVMANGCVKTTCIEVYLGNQDSCGVYITSVDTLGAGVLYIANPWGTPPFAYQWSNGETQQSTFVDFGIHDLCVTVTDATGCVATACNYPLDSCYANIIYSAGPIHALYIEAYLPLTSVLWSTGDTLPYIEITTPGTYCATVTNIIGCETNTCITIDSLLPGESYNVISGVVFGDTLSSLSGQVFAYAYDPNSGTSFAVADSAEITPGGLYKFTDLPNGLYIMKAVLSPNSQDAEDYLPTYSFNSTSWETAFTYSMPNWFPISADIFLVRTSDMNGGGVIGGVITDPNHLVAGKGEEERGQSGLGQIEVLISDAQGNTFNYTWSHEDGSFRFPGLPWGTYRISYDIAGLTFPGCMGDPYLRKILRELQVDLIVNQGTTAVDDPGYGGNQIVS